VILLCGFSGTIMGGDRIRKGERSNEKGKPTTNKKPSAAVFEYQEANNEHGPKSMYDYFLPGLSLAGRNNKSQQNIIGWHLSNSVRCEIVGCLDKDASRSESIF